uniref:LOW QUALITY PROTEIN: immunoglobulin superfamily member 1-like n=1 Tax=Phascolarctos cinereus TaxID=38626 RepID=UPI000A2893B4|nr:LOW QUALITY PROTEIN: immunoglobulin superfamily member 1-like [Phascolarctos cinereus]
MALAPISLFFLGLCCIYMLRAQIGSLPKPFLSALPGPVVAPGGELILWCRRPSESFDWLVTFSLLKSGTQEPLQKKDLVYSQAKFSLKSLGVQDSGNYRCIYYETSSPHVKSEPSDVLEIWVTDTLPKPSLSAWPSPMVTSGGEVTLLCRGPVRGMRFALYKYGEEAPVGTSEWTQDGAEFPLIHVSINRSGRCRCCYLLVTDSPILALPSDSLELIIQGMQDAASEVTGKYEQMRAISAHLCGPKPNSYCRRLGDGLVMMVRRMFAGQAKGQGEGFPEFVGV